MSNLRKFLSIILVLALLSGLLVTGSFTAGAADGVEYVECSWDSTNQTVVKTVKTCTDYNKISGTHSYYDLDAAWYLIDGDATITNRVRVTGAAHIILKSGTLTCKEGIHLGKGNSLYIYSAKDSSGALDAQTGGDEQANLGGNNGEDCGTLEVHGGTITAKNNDYYEGAAAIGGGGKGGKCGSLTFYGGKVTATNKGHSPGYRSWGAVIGDGNDADSASDSGCKINIYGGEISADNSKYSTAAAIGGGEDSKMCAVNILGGKVTAKSYNGAGIGSGQDGKSSPITIKRAEITAESEYGAGIGSGEDSDCESIIIENSVVSAKCTTESDEVGAEGAGIGGGNCGKSKFIRINKSIVMATSGRYGAGIGGGDESDGGDIIITNSNVFASSCQGGAGIGGGDEKGCNSITLKHSYIAAVTDSEINTVEENFLNKHADYYNNLMTAINNPALTEQHVAYAAGNMTAMLIAQLIRGTHTGAGIGSGDSGNVETITIEDCVVMATAGECAAGIGGGDEGGFGTINIKDSEIRTQGGDYGAGIGTGDEAEKTGTIHITGSSVTANAGTDAAGIGTGNEADETAAIHITDSDITAHGGRYGAGIGGGDAVSGGTIEINNSTVEADSKTDGAGIGGGESGNSGTITITDSNVTARGGGYAAGIGSGDSGDGGDITMTGSTVNAYGGQDAAGIGGGEDGNGGNITIENANVYAEGKGYGAGIGDGEDGDTASIRIYGSRTTVEAIAGGDGNAAALGHAGNSAFYAYHISSWYEDILVCDAGSDKNHTSRYYGDDRYTATANAKYVYFSICEHTNTAWIYDSEYRHVQQCTDCGMRRYSTSRNHEWNENNVCTVCGCSAVMSDITFVEQDAGGNAVTSKVTGPVSGTIQAPAATHAPEGMEFVCWKEYSYYVGAGEPIGVSGRARTFEAVYLPVTQATYIDSEGNEKSVTARRLTHTDLELTAGWYVVDSNIQSIYTMTIAGDVKLILADGATFSFYQGFSYQDLDHIDCLVTAQGMSSTLSVYGQSGQTGTLLIGNRHTVLTDFAQYGGIVDSQIGFFESTKNCVIEAGSFTAAVLVCDRAAILGGNVLIGNLPLNKSLQLGWKQTGDSIHFDALESEETSIVAGKAMQDESGNIYKEELSDAQVEALAGKTLTAAFEHQYGEPEWIWANDYCDATAVFRCEDCGEELWLNAKVTVEENDNIRTSTASCSLNGKTYTATHSAKFLWDIQIEAPVHGTLSADKVRAAAGETVTITATADEGYQSDTLQVCDSEGREIELYKNSFKMPESDVSTSASFKIKTYTVSWIVGGETVETDQNVPYGATPEYNGTTPASYFDGDAEYVFAGWSPAVAPVTEDVVYTAAYAASGKVRVPYIDENGAPNTATATVLSGSETALESGWYVALTDVNFSGIVKVGEGVNLILADGANVTVNRFDYADYQKFCSLSVFAQSGRTGSLTTENTNALPGIAVYGGNVNMPFILAMRAGFYAGNLQLGSVFVPAEGEEVTLGCAGEDDSIAIGTLNDSAVKVVPGQILSDGTALYSGTLTSAQVGALYHKTLRRATYHTVNWVVGESLVETDENVIITSVPSFDGVVPDYEDAQTHYTFCGWSDGTHTYAADALPAVTKDVTYTAVYSETPRQHNNGSSLTLNDGVSLNVYLDADSYGLDASKAVVKLTYNHNADVSKEQAVGTDVIALSEATKYIKSGDSYSGTYKFSFKMAPAQFADDITIELYESAKAAEPVFSATTSVKVKCEQVKTLAAANGAYVSFAALCGALEDYCTAAQVYFAYNAPATPAYNNDAVTTLTAADMEVPEAGVGIDTNGYSFTVVSGLEVNIFYEGDLNVTGVSIDSTKGVNALTAATAAKGGKNCINIKGIASGNFDNLVTVGTTKGDITLAATTIAKAIVAGSGNADYVNLARALYLYSVQASTYFGC
ncbi:MAG: hypothetical protein IJI67_03505 [Clostridia bacterium]|nr:hypothetical protein [Clostridia bacterium]